MKTLLKITIALFLLYILVSLFGCGQKQWRQRGLKKGWIDTSTVKNDFGVKPDSAKADSIITIFITEYDTIKTVEKKTKYLKQFIDKYNEVVYPDTILSFPDGSKARIWFENGILKGALQYKHDTFKELPKTWWEQWRDWIYGAFALIILFGLFWKRK